MGDSIMDRLRDMVLFVSGAIAIVSLILALYEGFNQRVGAATFLAALFVAATFMVFLPKLEEGLWYRGDAPTDGHGKAQKLFRHLIATHK
jgi:hypothetical protein